MKFQEAYRITALCARVATPAIVESIASSGSLASSIQPARGMSLREERGFLGLRRRPAIDQRGADLIRVILPLSRGREAAEAAFSAGGLGENGRGSIMMERCRIRYSGVELPKGEKAAAGKSSPLSRGLCGIACIVQRGQGDELARTVLEMGFSAPVAGFGKGMGLRSKLGLLRIAIPAEKEVLYFLVEKNEADEAMAFLDDTIGFDLPGKGFVYRFPVEAGYVDTRIYDESERKHVASMEQVITAIDGLTGGAEWRRRSTRARIGRQRGFSKASESLLDLSLVCEAGFAEEFSAISMEAGASGATLMEAMALSFACGKEETRRANEISDLVLSASCAEKVLEAIDKRGFFGSEAKGGAELSLVDDASGYVSRRA